MGDERVRWFWSSECHRRHGRWSAVVLLVLVFFSAAGCEIIGMSEDDPARRIDYEIEFRVAEKHEVAPEAPDVPKIFFTMRTKTNFGCAGYDIRHEVERADHRVVVRALGIGGPTGCLTVLAPASARFELPLDPGTYTLVLVNGELRDEYRAVVTDRKVEVTAARTGWTEPIATLYWRYPRDSFAYYCGTTRETKSLCTDFESRLQDLPLTRIEVPEDGEWPYRLQTTGHHYDAPAQFYRYPDESTWEEVKARLRTFTRERIQDREGIGLEVENWLFDGVMSWMVDR